MSRALKCTIHPTRLMPIPGGGFTAAPYMAHLTRSDVLQCLFNDARVFRIYKDGSTEEIMIDDVLSDSETGEDIFKKPDVIVKVCPEAKKESTMKITVPDGTEKKVLITVDEKKKKKHVEAIDITE